MFIFVFGLYTVIKLPLDRKLGKKGRLAAKFIYINVALVISYSILLFIFPVAVLVNEFGTYSASFIALLAVMFWLVFFMYDKAVENVLIIYIRKFRKMFFR
jgi:hypothetical protein